ncbi:MAG: hypothetical protein COA58_12760 [Bacteroidetes bacterium]|nr:MAG: hypothetical protein COA58_12760 [Bacteroidota bacterium]
MKKIAFVGIILVSGLFSLQYSLFGSHGERYLQNNLPAFETEAFCAPNEITKYQVIYICPDDSSQLKKLEEAVRILL